MVEYMGRGNSPRAMKGNEMSDTTRTASVQNLTRISNDDLTWQDDKNGQIYHFHYVTVSYLQEIRDVLTVCADDTPEFIDMLQSMIGDSDNPGYKMPGVLNIALRGDSSGFCQGEWIEGLADPTGVAILSDMLYQYRQTSYAAWQEEDDDDETLYCEAVYHWVSALHDLMADTLERLS